jgi:hypothetical protein
MGSQLPYLQKNHCRKKNPSKGSETPPDSPESLAKHFYDFYHAFA